MGDKSISRSKRDLYQYYATLMEPWDGPASILFSDGDVVGAVLDRNGLRPSRYYVTTDDRLILASEVGVLDLPADQIVQKSRLQPGRMLLVDMKQGRIIGDDELKEAYGSPVSHTENGWTGICSTWQNSPFPISGCQPGPRQSGNGCERPSGTPMRMSVVPFCPMARTGAEPTGRHGH